MKMNKLKILGLIATYAILFSSCNNDDDVKDNSIAGIASRTTDLTLLVQALDKAGLVETLKTGNYTVFAPTNDAFIEAGYTSAAIADLPESGIPALQQLLLNHVLSNTNLSTSLTNNMYVKTLGKGAVSSTNTLSMHIGVTGSGATTVVTLNGGAQVVTADIEASNGVIHIVDEVIGLPTVVTHATANSNFSTLASLLTTQNLISTLSSSTTPSPFTVFAPLNSAFDTATLNLYGGLTSAQKTAVLTYHVIGGANVLSTGIPASSPTLETGILQFSGTTITDEQNRQTNIVLTDVQCSNGIIHAVNKVLLPQL